MFFFLCILLSLWSTCLHVLSTCTEYIILQSTVVDSLESWTRVAAMFWSHVRGLTSGYLKVMSVILWKH